MIPLSAGKTAGLAIRQAATRRGPRVRRLHASACSPRGDRRGVTAVELAVVLAVVAILGFAGYPLLSNVRQVLLVKGAVEQMAGGIRLARQFAITQGSNYCIEFRSSPATQYQIRQADNVPSCSGTVVDGYGWQDVADSNGGSVVTTAPTLIFDPIGNRILPVGPTNTAFNVDTVPSSCVSVVTVTLYGGLRVAGC